MKRHPVSTFRRTAIRALAYDFIEVARLAEIMGADRGDVDDWLNGAKVPKMAGRFLTVLHHVARRWRKDLDELRPGRYWRPVQSRATPRRR